MKSFRCRTELCSPSLVVPSVCCGLPGPPLYSGVTVTRYVV